MTTTTWIWEGQWIIVTTARHGDYEGESRGLADGAVHLETPYGLLVIPVDDITDIRRCEN